MALTVIDYSYGHAEITPTAIRKVPGCVGGIAYAGCSDTGKNITKAEFRALVGAGHLMGLVIENSATDLRKGATEGARQGSAILAAAKRLGYDWRNCVLFTGYDTNAHPADYHLLLAGMEAYARKVPVPGYYGDQDSIDYLAARHPDWIFWQSASSSFGNGVSAHAHLHQLVGGSHGLPIDVNTVLREPLRLMGEDDMPSLDDYAHAVWKYNQQGKKREAWALLQEIPQDVWDAIAESVDKSFKTSMRRFVTGNNDDAERTKHAVATNSQIIADLDKRFAHVEAAVDAQGKQLEELLSLVKAKDAVAGDVKVTISGEGTAHVGPAQ